MGNTESLKNRVFGKIRVARHKIMTNETVGEKEKKIVKESGLFDEAFYREGVGKLPKGISALEHFLLYGAKNKVSPSENFDANAYLTVYKDVHNEEMNPLLHYLEYGQKEGRKSFAVKSVPAGIESKRGGKLVHIKESANRGLIINSPFFDKVFYVEKYRDILLESGHDPVDHYLAVGVSKDLQPSIVFDPIYYKKKYKDVGNSEVIPLVHYIEHGFNEGRIPCSFVEQLPADVLSYWNKKLDVGASCLHFWCEACLANKEKKWSNAEKSLQELLELDSQSAIVYNQLAHALRRQGKWWQEIEALKKAIELEGHHADWHYRLAEALEVMRRFQQAANAYGRAIELKEGKIDAQWYYRQGYCYARDGHDGKVNMRLAEKAYQKAIANDDKHDSQHLGIGVFHEKLGHWAQAAAAYESQLADTPLDEELNYRLGMAYDRCYEWESAEYYYVLALALDLDKPDWHYRLGFVRERQGKYLQAASSYHYAALTRHKHTPYWFYRWGCALEQAGEYQQACDAFVQSRQQRDFDGQAFIQEQIAESKDEILKNIEKNGNENIFSATPIDSLEEYKKELVLDNQIEVLNQLLARDYTSTTLWYRLGNLCEVNQQWPQAVDAYWHAVVRKNAHAPEWYFRLGHALAKEGSYAKACEAFRSTRVLQTAYGTPETPFKKSPGFREAATYTEFYENLPLMKNTALYESFHGGSMSCNPYALFLHISSRKEFKDWVHIWVINSLANVPKIYREYKNIIFVERNSDAYMRFLASVEVLINNTTFPTYFIRKTGQKYLNTWHGTPWKTMGRDIKNNFMEHKNTQRNFLHTTHLISPNAHTTKVLTERYDIDGIYAGKIAETGYPRIDLTLNNNEIEKNKIRQKLKIDPDKKVILYAPTWRGTLGAPEIEIEKLIGEIDELNKLDCHLLFKGHYFVESSVYEAELGGIVVPGSMNTNELLSVVDVLITDYSSISFDFMATGKPIVYYLDDYQDYRKDRGLYFSYEEMPGRKAFSLQELKNEVEKTLDEKANTLVQKEKANDFIAHENGNVSQIVVDWVLKDVPLKGEIKPQKSKKSLLFCAGEFMPNGITVSFLNLMNEIDYDQYEVSVAISPDAVLRDSKHLDQFYNLPQAAKTIPRVGRMCRTIEEEWIEKHFSRHNEFPSINFEETYRKLFHREFIRMFGHSCFDSVVEFSGYSRFWSSLLGCAPGDQAMRKSIYQHNDKYGEWSLKHPNLGGTFYLYKFFDNIVSVSKNTRDLNRAKLANLYRESPDKFIYCNNLQNPKGVVEKSKFDLDYEDEIIFDKGEAIFITLGRLSPEKDHAKLIDAFSRLRESLPKAQLLILGDGPLKNYLATYIRNKGQEGYIHLLGQRINPFPLIKKSDCFVLASNHEGQPMVLFEAMALNKPIIATDIVGSRSALEGRSGHLVTNSEEGLLQGMKDFLNNKLSFGEIDFVQYQAEAINMFYENICGDENEREKNSFYKKLKSIF